MIHTALTTLLLLAPAAYVVASPQGDLEDLVREQAAAAEGMPIAELWKEARTVAVLVGDEAGAEFDVAIDSVLRSGTPSSGKSVLFLAAMRLLGEDVDFELLTGAVRPLLDDGDLEVALGAAEMLGMDIRSETDDLREMVATDLLRVADDGDRMPELRVECAVSAHRVGLGKHVSSAQRVLYLFLKSADPALKSKGALALARLGNIEVRGVEAELERLASLPGEEGRLAGAYMHQQLLRRHSDTQLRRLRERRTLASDAAMSADLVRIDKVIELVQTLHLEGHTVTREELIAAAIDGLLRSLDRHSAYFRPEVFQKFEQELEAEYGGIGAYVAEDRDDSLFTITRPIYSGPAWRAGLTTDDKIVRIDDWPTIGEEVDDIIKRLKGRPNTEVKLYVWRRGMDPALIERPTEDMAVTMSREQIVIPPVHSEYLPGDIGFVELTTFSRVSSAELKQRMVDMMAQGMRGFILDLRNNTGGLLIEARNVADLFLPKHEVVVSTESHMHPPHEYKTRTDALLPADMPVVVLINRFSASASEIVAGALQDHERAKLVGQRSFGKGSVQNLFQIEGDRDDLYADENKNGRFDNWETITKDWNGNGEFDFAPRVKLTIERYLLPSGRSIHRELDDERNIISVGGVSPDIQIAPRRWKQWRLEELLRIQGDRTVRKWAQDGVDGNEELFERLAQTDNGDPWAYPGFEELYESLATTLPEDDVRFLMRREVRRVVQDIKGEAFPLGDYEEDVQLQAAIRAVLAELDLSPEDIPAYASTFSKQDEGPVAALDARPQPSRDLDHALSLIAEARVADGRMSEEGLRELTELIESLKKNGRSALLDGFFVGERRQRR
ncbi:MAG: S41 family peptidase [Planctomycetota bacterium]|nr:MAG: S41 family peptidase [Planctomycetota bacterium]